MTVVQNVLVWCLAILLPIQEIQDYIWALKIDCPDCRFS
jgi:hypothetical protein